MALAYSMGVAGTLTLSAPSLVGQELIAEGEVPAAAIAQAPTDAYQPCSPTNFARAGMCLADRIREVQRVSTARFEGSNWTCRLFHASDPRPEQFRCGELLVGLRHDIDWRAIREIREAANGEWTQIYAVGGPISARLHVEPGTERSALRNIIFHPMVLWVEFNHSDGTTFER